MAEIAFSFLERTPDCHLLPKINPELEISVYIFYINLDFPVANQTLFRSLILILAIIN